MKEMLAMMGPTSERFKEENPNPTWNLAYEKYVNGEDPDGAVAWMLCENAGYFTKIANRFGAQYDSDTRIEVSIDGVMKALANYDPERGTSFHTFVYTCLRSEWRCKHRADTSVTRSSGHPVISLEQELNYGDGSVCDRHSFLGEFPEEIGMLEWLDIIDRVRLSERQRIIITESIIRGETNLKIAEMLGTTPQNVSELKSRALSKIRYYLDTEVE